MENCKKFSFIATFWTLKNILIWKRNNIWKGSSVKGMNMNLIVMIIELVSFWPPTLGIFLPLWRSLTCLFHVVFFFPNGHWFLKLIEGERQSFQTLFSMWRTDSDDDTCFFYGNKAQTVIHCDMLNIWPSLPYFVTNSGHLFFCHLIVCFILKWNDLETDCEISNYR